MTPLVAYLLLFVAVGAAFIFVHLMAGKLLRPSRPSPEKGTIYECGEPTIGSAWIQFDLRFYVVALLFVIFDVEVAFFFPWAVVFGKANDVAAYRQRPATEAELRQYGDQVRQLIPPYPEYANYRTQTENLKPAGQADESDQKTFSDTQDEARGLAWMAFWDIVIFFGVLLVGFAYLWRRGDLAWVRSVTGRQPAVTPPPAPAPQPAPSALAGAGSRS